MKHNFVDKYSGIDSPVHRIDPRIKLIVSFVCIAVVVSDSRSGFAQFALYFLLTALLTVLSRVPAAHILKRCLIVSPFIFMASLFLPLSHILAGDTVHGPSLGASPKAALMILCKAFLAVILLNLLSSTEKFHRLLSGMRRLKIPSLVGTILALIYRSVFVLIDETQKTTRARQSRTPGTLKMPRMTVYGRQVAIIFLRSWKRSQVIYTSMLSRGFNGEFPCTRELSLSRYDLLSGGIVTMLFLAVRLWSF
ncbi:MAG TPA: cobalt ECF transporter T component CbiQ [bacterium]|nr:cobalt ECF transporter T component CbiQ [bacterium]